MKLLTYIALVGSTNAVKCPFGFTKGTKPGAAASELAQDETKDTTDGVRYPSEMFTCPTAAVMKTDVDKFGHDEYEATVASILDQYEELTKTKTPDGQVADEARMAGCLLRFAGHDLMDYRKGEKDIGGSDGCIDFSTGDNAGLESCLKSAKIPEAYAKHCNTVSLADFTVIAAEAVMGRTSPTYNATDPFAEDTLLETFRDNFLAGRETANTCPWSVDRMPNAEDGEAAMKEVFVDHVFNASKDGWRMASAIIGAHTLGGASLENSGYDGTWSDAKDQGVFNNGYYKSLLLKGWGPEIAVNGDEDKNQWIRVDRGTPKDQKQMMLNTDIGMVFKQNEVLAQCVEKANQDNSPPQGSDSKTRKAAKDSQRVAIKKCIKEFGGRKSRSLPGVKAQNGECCAWISNDCLASKKAFPRGKSNVPEDYCGIEALGKDKKRGDNIEKGCCENIGSDSFGDCDNVNDPQGPGYKIMAKYVASEEHWLDDFTSAWKLATTNGHSGLRYLDQTKADPEPIMDECAAFTKERSCKLESNGRCMWKRGARQITNRWGKVQMIGECVPFERKL